MPSSSRHTFLKVNIALVLLIGIMFWYLSTKGESAFTSQPSSDPAPVATKQAPADSSPASSTQGLSKADAEAIEVLQAQLELEKARADKTRLQLQVREREREKKTQSVRAPAAAPAQDNLEVEQQKLLIAKMIKAQLEGANENRRLTQALSQKNQEIVAVKQQNTDLAKRLVKLDSSTQALLDTLVKEGKNISSSDQDYLSALQGGTADPQPSANQPEVDLINRVEVADNGDSGTVTAELRMVVGKLMDAEKQTSSQTNVVVAPKATTPEQTNDFQNKINDLLVRNKEQEAERQFQADEDYLESLTPMEKERRNETRWVTVREGDTLFDIASRVYNDGKLYYKIFKANPQVLNNPDQIKTGQRLRVPL